MIYILTGDIETGKSSALLEWFQNRNNVYGVLSPRNDLNERYLLDVSTKESFVMQTNLEDDSTISVGRYHFLKSAFKKANEIIQKTAINVKSGYIVIDEIGKLELGSEGLHASALRVIERTMRHKELHVILVVRATLLGATLEKYNIINPEIITIEELSEGYIEANVTLVTK